MRILSSTVARGSSRLDAEQDLTVLHWIGVFHADLADCSADLALEPGEGLREDGDAARGVGESDVVGERGVLEDNLRSATVTATSHMLTYAISRQRLLALVEKSPTAKRGMFEYMRRRYSD